MKQQNKIEQIEDSKLRQETFSLKEKDLQCNTAQSQFHNIHSWVDSKNQCLNLTITPYVI